MTPGHFIPWFRISSLAKWRDFSQNIPYKRVEEMGLAGFNYFNLMAIIKLIREDKLPSRDRFDKYFLH